jgi:hypothetical protein
MERFSVGSWTVSMALGWDLGAGCDPQPTVRNALKNKKVVEVTFNIGSTQVSQQRRLLGSIELLRYV